MRQVGWSPAKRTVMVAEPILVGDDLGIDVEGFRKVGAHSRGSRGGDATVMIMRLSGREGIAAATCGGAWSRSVLLSCGNAIRLSHAGNATRNAAQSASIELSRHQLSRYQWVGSDLQLPRSRSHVESLPGLHLDGQIKIVPGLELLIRTRAVHEIPAPRIPGWAVRSPPGCPRSREMPANPPWSSRCRVDGRREPGHRRSRQHPP